ncbi:MAG: putative lipid II flippase FtsW [Proteobacteria bacterium]|nr:putative lipid II flippase FtsW [Pseudomonadota bacterium]MCH8263304.1 putative lipid II flippase FtsW [Pseudomonadota bacterium]MCH8977287.1 putative lipid II flippase FtsW [Pseudomonadota bacterium]
MYRPRQAIPQSHLSATNGLFRPYDAWLMTVIFLLIGLGLVMVASSSIAIADRQFHEPLHYFWRQMFSAAIGLSFIVAALKIPLSVWEFLSVPLLVLGLLLLLLVLIPGIGREVNGSTRWISVGSLAIQASEPVKLCVIVYLASYMVRHGEHVRNNFAGFIRPICVLTIVAGLLLLEPDYGSCVVLFATALGMLFMGGVPLGRFFAWVLTAVVVLASLAVLSPYRIQRLMSFVDPWQDPFNSGFQLTQALIAFGRGDWFGVGLGSSVQKLFYLPEAHTDFVFSVFAEEFGLMGTTILILLFSFLVWRAFVIGHIAERMGKLFAAYLAYGIGLIIGVQVFINMGVNLGVLPTKGLTLPLLSYGGNSMVITCLLLGILLRVEVENRQIKRSPDETKCYAE